MDGKDFLEQDHCDRCYGDLMVRTQSWFNRDVVCGECSLWEEKIIDAQEESKSELEGIGRIPDVEFDVNWGEEPDGY